MDHEIKDDLNICQSLKQSNTNRVNGPLLDNSDDAEEDTEKVSYCYTNRATMKKFCSSIIAFIAVCICCQKIYQNRSTFRQSTLLQIEEESRIQMENRRKLDVDLEKIEQQKALLDNESVILISGGAGFLGTNLALALHFTFSPKLIILVDPLDAHQAWAEMRSSSASAKSPSDYSQKILQATSRAHSNTDDLKIIEYKRQRLFHVLATLGDKCIFYKSDIRPTIPEFWDVGELPTLDMIWKHHPDITHVIHLADGVVENAKDSQAVPHVKDQTKSGLIEAILEMLKKLKQKGQTPQFVYASSSEVYDKTTKAVPHKETQLINAPMSLRGAGKLMDEILVNSYFQSDAIFSTGLRFFSVYGPWGAPSSYMYQLAERAVLNSASNPLKSLNEEDSLDFVYIDDAIDAIMAAMQYRPPPSTPPVVFNIGSGTQTSFKKLKEMIHYYFPKPLTHDYEENLVKSKPTVSFADINMARIHLGYIPQVSLQDGIVKLLAWHYDRLHPYLTPPYPKKYHNAFISSHGISSCNPLDAECLKGTSIFPCASECARESNCLPSIYESVLKTSNEITKQCVTVLFTIAIDDYLTSIPSAYYKLTPVDADSTIPHLKEPCNIAFVSKFSPLFQSSTSSKHGFWTLIPLSYTRSSLLDMFLPKYSPGKFFSHSKYAIYTDANILMKSLPKIVKTLKETTSSEQWTDHNMLLPHSTIALISSFRSNKKFTNEERIQQRAYTMFRIALRGELRMTTKDLDTSWLAYSLSHDTKELRCDIFSDAIQWNVPDTSKAIYFVSSLHDLWSKSFWKQSESNRKLLEDDEEDVEEEKPTLALDKGEWFTFLGNYWIRILENSDDHIIRLPAPMSSLK